MSRLIIEQSTLTEIGDAIREKTGKTDLIPVPELANEIMSIAGGGNLSAGDLSFNGILDELFENGHWDFILEKYPTLITFYDVLSAEHMFSKSGLEDLSMFEIPVVNAYISSMFSNCYDLTKLPKVTGTVLNIEGLFSYCHGLSDDEINKFFENISVDWSSWQFSSVRNCFFYDLFTGCNEVRDLTVPINWVKTQMANCPITTKEESYYSTFNRCWALDELINLPVFENNKMDSRGFTYAFNECSHLKELQFETDDGVPRAALWSEVVIDLTNYVGYGEYSSLLTTGGAHLPANAEVRDSTTYQALKDNPDWWTISPFYSRYNHDSAVNTINSLPDTTAYLATAGGTNTIKFLGSSGSDTDGGAINTLTAEEIAVATNKGWTVSIK